MHWHAAIALLPAFTRAAKAIGSDPKPCDIAQSVISKFHGAAALSSVCHSVFGTPRPPSTTATRTVTTTRTVPPPKVTQVVSVTKHVVVTETFTSYSVIDKTVFGGTSTFTDAIIVQAYETVTQDYSGQLRRDVEKRGQPNGPVVINGVEKAILSEACSCLVPSPTPTTTTRTVTSTVTRGYPNVVISTSTVTETSTKEVTVKKRTTVTDTTYSYATVSPTETVTFTLTTCHGRPSASFLMQISDLTATKTDEFNSKFVTQTPVPDYLLPAWSFDTVDSASDAALYGVDCVGRLTTKVDTPGVGAEDYYGFIDYFQVGFESIRFFNQSYLLENYFYFVMAEERGVDDLYVYANQSGVGILDILQTVPEYKDVPPGEDPIPFIILGDFVPTDGPDTSVCAFKRVAPGSG